MLRRRPGGLPYPKAQLGPSAPAEGPATAGVPQAEYTFGTHAATIYNAEAAKSTVWRSVVGVTVAVLGSYVSAPPQAYADVQPVVQRAVVAGNTPRIPTFVNAAPQQIDLTQQAVISRPTVGPQGPTVRSFTAGPLQIDLTQQAVYVRPLVAAFGILGRVQSAAPQQVDLTLPAVIIPSAPGYSGPPSYDVYTFGAHAEATYNAEAAKSKTWPSAQSLALIPAVSPAVFVGQQSYSDPQPVVQESAIKGQTPPVIRAQWTPQQEYTDSQAWVQRSAPGQQGPTVRSFTAGPLQIDLTQQAVVIATQPQLGIPKVLGVSYAVPEQAYVNVAAVVVRAAVKGQTSPVIPFQTGAPPQFDYTLQPVIIEPLVAGAGKLGTYVSAAPVDPTQLAAQIEASALAPPALPGLLGTFYFAAPPAFDYTVQAVTVRSSIAGSGKLGAYVTASPIVDLTLQASLSRPVVGPIGPVPPMVVAAPQTDPSQLAAVTSNAQPAAPIFTGPTIPWVFAAPLPIDLTIQAQIFTIAAAPPAPSAIPPGGHGYDWATDVTLEGQTAEANRRKTEQILRIRRLEADRQAKIEAERTALGAAEEASRLAAEQHNQAQFASESQDIADDYARLIREFVSRVDREQGKKRAKAEAQLSQLRLKAEAADTRLAKAKARAAAVAERRAAMLAVEREARLEAAAAAKRIKDEEDRIEEERRIAQAFMIWLMREDDD
jgi:hypothetical protein